MSGSSSTIRIRAIFHFPYRKNNRERASLSRFAIELHAAMMRCDNFLHHRQPDPGSLDSAPSRFLTPLEFAENQRTLAQRNSDALVSNIDGHFASGSMDSNFDDSPVR